MLSITASASLKSSSVVMSPGSFWGTAPSTAPSFRRPVPRLIAPMADGNERLWHSGGKDLGHGSKTRTASVRAAGAVLF
jgi:hypothetical protein